MSTFTSFRLMTRADYPPNDSCRTEAATEFEDLTTLDGSRGWVDVGRDGTVDAMRDGNRLVIASDLVPGWQVPTRWVSIPVDSKAPANLLFGVTSPAAEAVRALLASPSNTGTYPETLPLLTGPFGGMTAPVALGEQTIEGHRTTHYILRAPKGTPGTVAVEAWVDSNDVLWQTRSTNTQDLQDPSSPPTQTATLIAYNQPVTVHLPPPTDITAVANTPVTPLLVTSEQFASACNPPAEASSVNNKRACVARRTEGQTVGAFLATPSWRDVMLNGC